MFLFQVRYSPALVVFFVWVVGGMFGAIFTKSILGIWYMMECMFIGVMAMICGGSMEENESAMKYYVFQIIGSLFMFLSFIMVFCGEYFGAELAYLLFSLGVLMKLGLFPFHFWVTSVMGLCSWGSFFIIGWIQKIPALWMIMMFGIPLDCSGVMEVSVWGTVIIGAFGGIGILQYRVLLAFSSLVQTGWLVMISISSVFVVLFYLCIYGVTLGIVLFKMNYYNLFSYLDHCNFRDGTFSSWKSEVKKVGLFLDMASLSGFPPFFGSVAKFMGVLCLWSDYYTSAMILVISSLLTFFFYLSMMMNFMVSVGVGTTKIFMKSFLFELNFFEVFFYLINMFGGLFLLVLFGFLS
nr:NADH dehydrogenase subunit 2 [Mytilopsis leucophaeata]